MLQFSQILQSLQQNNLHPAWDSDTAFSLPVSVLRGKKAYDALFVYRAPIRKKPPTAPRPFQWLLLCPQSGQAVLWCDCAVQDFISSEHYPSGCEVDMSQKKPLTAKKYTYLHARLLELYEQIRTFAFALPVHPAQQKLLDEYRELFVKVAYTGHYPFYQALAPDFFAWLGLRLCEDAYPAESSTQTVMPAAAIAPQYDTAKFSQLYEKLDMLEGLFQQKIARDLHKERLFDELHRELQTYKNGLADSLLLPLERDVIKLIDDVRKTAAFYREASPDAANYKKLLRMYEGVETDLTDLLYRYGVEPFSEPGDDVVPARQMIVSTLAADNAALDKKIAVRHVSGWEKGGRVIRPERISVYVQAEKPDSPQ